MFDDMYEEIMFKLKEIQRFLEKHAEAKNETECAPELSD